MAVWRAGWRTCNLLEAGFVQATAGEVEVLAGKGLLHHGGVGKSGQLLAALGKMEQLALVVVEERAGWGHVLQVLDPGVSPPPLPHSNTPPSLEQF